MQPDASAKLQEEVEQLRASLEQHTNELEQARALTEELKKQKEVCQNLNEKNIWTIQILNLCHTVIQYYSITCVTIAYVIYTDPTQFRTPKIEIPCSENTTSALKISKFCAQKSKRFCTQKENAILHSKAVPNRPLIILNSDKCKVRAQKVQILHPKTQIVLYRHTCTRPEFCAPKREVLCSINVNSSLRKWKISTMTCKVCFSSPNRAFPHKAALPHKSKFCAKFSDSGITESWRYCLSSCAREDC